MAARASDGPRVRVAAVLELEGRILFVRHRKGASEYHLLPGGGVERGETLEEALTREVREETGLECRVVKPLFISDTVEPGGGMHVVNLTFLAEVTGGTLAAPADDPRVAGADLLGPEGLDDLDLRPPIAALLAEAAAAGFAVEARYLGPLWTEGARGST